MGEGVLDRIFKVFRVILCGGPSQPDKPSYQHSSGYPGQSGPQSYPQSGQQSYQQPYQQPPQPPRPPQQQQQQYQPQQQPYQQPPPSPRPPQQQQQYQPQQQPYHSPQPVKPQQPQQPHQYPHKPSSPPHKPSSPPHKPSSPPHKPSSPPPQQQQQGGPKHKPGRPHEDPNQVNQNDPFYTNLRARANQEGDAMARCFAESKQAYTSGDGAKAKELSNQGKHHQSEMERLNREASDWIFRENNTDSGPNEIDLHGLYVKEAIAYSEQAILEAQRRGDSTVHFIVGKGLHSRGGVAKLKPAIEELMVKYRLEAHLDPHNEGVLVVALGGAGGSVPGQTVTPNEITRRLEREDESCVIM